MNSIRTIVWVLMMLVFATSAPADEQSPQRASNVKPAPDPSGEPRGPTKGTILLCSCETKAIRERFITLAGGPNSHFVVVLNRLTSTGSPVLREVEGFLQKLSSNTQSKDLTNVKAA